MHNEFTETKENTDTDVLSAKRVWETPELESISIEATEVGLSVRPLEDTANAISS